MYEFQSRVRYSEVGYDEQLTLESVLNYFQDCSTFHSEDIGVGLDFFKSRMLGWVLSSWQIDVYRYPTLCENITIGTFPYEFKGASGYRNFYMEDAGGNCLVQANSIWTLLDLTKKVPIKLTQEIIDAYQLDEKLPMKYEPRKIQNSVQGMRQEPIQVKNHHLDTNLHVNNGQYVKIAKSLIPQEKKVQMVRVEYKKPAMLGDVLVPYLNEMDGRYVVSLKTEDQTENYSIVEFSLENKEITC